MSKTISIAPVHKSIVVEAPAQHAFEVFTAGIDRWWPKTHGIGEAPIVKSVIEPGVGGRWYTTHTDGKDAVIGHFTVWEPCQRFVLTWEINSSWKPDARVAFASEVEVRFVAESATRTRLELEHRNFERMGAEDGAKMRAAVEGGWVALIALFAAAAASGGSKS